MSKFAYHEPKEALNTRINAHKKYSNFNLHDWVNEKFDIAPGSRILDVGCGNGNFTSLFWDHVKPEGTIFGIDKNDQLIEQARERSAQLSTNNIQFQVGDFDKASLGQKDGFNWIFSIYSLYYTEDSLLIVQKIKEMLAPGGTFVVLGPGPDNIKDLIDFSHQLTGVPAKKEFIDRIERIAREFTPLFQKLFGEDMVTYEEVDTKMTFPTAEEYFDYYQSSLLWRDSTEHMDEVQIGQIKAKAIAQLQSSSLVIKKQMSYLAGKIS